MPILEYFFNLWFPTVIRDFNVLENALGTFTRLVFYKCGLIQITYKDWLVFISLDCVAFRHLILSQAMFYNIY